MILQPYRFILGVHCLNFSLVAGNNKYGWLQFFFESPFGGAGISLFTLDALPGLERPDETAW